MPSSVSRQKLARSVSKAKARVLQPPPSSARKTARKASPGAPERSTRAASKTVESRAAAVPPSAPAARKPADAGERVAGPKQLWLMKTDPDYMVDKLVRDIETTWTGVRGYEARNLLRDHFRVGDQVLFYHSGDPKHMSNLSGGKITQPGIAAVCVVSKAAFPEVGAPLNSKGEVQWYSVGVRLVCVISPQLSLQQLRSETCLAGMDLFLRSRLSIQRVEAPHWHHIMSMAALHNSPYFKQ